MAQLLFILLPVLTIVLFTWLFFRNRRSRKPKHTKDDPRTRLERAVWAWGKILSANQGPLSSFRMARVDLELEVHLPGTPAYQAKTAWLVEQEALAYVAQGQEVSLKVDPLAPKYVFPSGGWAKYLE